MSVRRADGPPSSSVAPGSAPGRRASRRPPSATSPPAPSSPARRPSSPGDQPALEALADQLGQRRVGLFLRPRHPGDDQEALAHRAVRQLRRRLPRGVAAHRAVAVRAQHLPQVGVEEAQDVVGLGDGADGGAGVLDRVLGLDRHRRQDAPDLLHRRPLHLVEELPGVGGHRLDEAALPFGVDGVEGEGRLAGPGRAGDHGHRAVGDAAGDALEVVGAGALDFQRPGGRGVLLRRHGARRRRALLPARLRGGIGFRHGGFRPLRTGVRRAGHHNARPAAITPGSLAGGLHSFTSSQKTLAGPGGRERPGPPGRRGRARSVSPRRWRGGGARSRPGPG